MEAKGDWRKQIKVDDCIDGARDALQSDPKSQVVWYNDHAYVIPSEATDDTEAPNIPRKLQIANTVFKVQVPFPPMTKRKLHEAISNRTALDITNLIRRMLK